MRASTMIITMTAAAVRRLLDIQRNAFIKTGP
jgi:hypothetical protein